MPQFTYIGRNDDGETVSGLLEALDASAARSSLRDLNISVEELRDSGIPDLPSSTNAAPQMTIPSSYAPLLDTLQLYAGWLLACLFVILSVGSYQFLRHLPWHADILDEWVHSQLIMRVTFITFSFLLLSSLHRAMGRGLWKGIALAILGFIAIAFFMANT